MIAEYGIEYAVPQQGRAVRAANFRSPGEAEQYISERINKHLAPVIMVRMSLSHASASKYDGPATEWRVMR